VMRLELSLLKRGLTPFSWIALPLALALPLTLALPLALTLALKLAAGEGHRGHSEGW